MVERVLIALFTSGSWLSLARLIASASKFSTPRRRATAWVMSPPPIAISREKQVSPR